MSYDRSVDVPKRLAERLAATPEVRFALLFGSRAGSRARADSDWDVAVYLDEALSTAQRTNARIRLASELEELGPVDVVVLNDADPLLNQRALGGELVDVKDRLAHVRHFVRIMGLAEDQRYFDAILALGRRRRLEEGVFGRP